MITTKAYITEVPSEDSNIYRVRVPLMEDNTETEAEFEAILSHSPGIYKGINVGDCVIVTYEDDKYDTAIILGKLFTEIPESENVFGKFDQLEVTGNVILPQDTKIGNYTTQDIFNLYQGVDMKEGGGGSINPDDLRQYVQWINTETTTSEGDIIDVYADKIRVMSGQEYDALIEELGSEGVEEDINFINTLHFLWSIPGTTPTGGGGDDEGGGGGGDDPTPGPEPEPEVPGLSFKALANYMSTKTPVDYSGHNKRALSIDLITVSLNKLLLNDRTGGGTYIYFQHFGWLEKNTEWGIIYKYLPYSPPSGKGAGNWKAGDFENLPQSTKLEVGDIVTFYKDSSDSVSSAVYCAVYAGNDEFYGSNYIINSNSTSRIKISKADIISHTSAQSYRITRITQALVNRHKGSPLT